MIFLSLSFYFLASGGVLYTYLGLRSELARDQVVYPVQTKIIALSNLLAIYQLEVQNKRLSPDLFDIELYAEAEKKIDELLIAVSLYLYKLDEDLGKDQKSSLQISKLEEFSKEWKHYKSLDKETSIREVYTRYLQLARYVKNFQNDLQRYYEIDLNLDVGTVKLIDTSFTTIQNLSLQIPVFYALMSRSPEFDWVNILKNGDLYGVNYEVVRSENNIQQALSGISTEIDPALGVDSRPILVPLIEQLIQANSSMREVIGREMQLSSQLVPLRPLEVYQISQNALESYEGLQEVLNQFLLSMSKTQFDVVIFRFNLSIVLTSFAIFMVVLLFASRIVRKPIQEICEAAAELAVGKVNVRIPIHFNDEVGEMAQAFNNLAAFLENKLKEVKGIAGNLLSSVQTIFEVARQLERNIQVQDNELGAVRGHITQISGTVKGFSLNLDNVYKSINATTGLADLGSKSLGEMEMVMQQMVKASNSIVNTLNVLKEKMNSINDVISAIVKIADQINLLSLNTAIQANKAGPEGKGFSVIARKIKELSGQAAFSTLDIEFTVTQIIESVNECVVLVDQFLHDVLLQVCDSTQISEEFKSLIDFFENQVEVFKSVNDDMLRQAESATEIQKVLISLSDAARKSTQSTNQFYREIEALHHSTTSLVEKIESFTHPSYNSLQSIADNYSKGN